jgi:hypothetical protein
VVSGLYRYVRNPIYVAVVAVILGQAVLFADWHLLGYGALIWLFFHIVVIAYEEPTRCRFINEGKPFRIKGWLRYPQCLTRGGDVLRILFGRTDTLF